MSETISTATIRVVADASGVEAGLRPAVDAARKAGQAVAQVGDGAAGAARNVDAASRNIIGSIQRTTAAMEAGGRQTAAYYELLAQQRGIDPGVLAPYIAQLRAAEGATHSLSFETAAAKRELLVLTHELSQGNFKRFGGSIMVLAEQTGAAGALFSATGLAAIGLGVAVVGVGAAMVKGAEEQKAMADALIMTGGYAGATSDSLNAMAHAAVEAGGSIGEAKKAVTELAGTGKFTAAQIGMIADAAIGMEHATGQSIEKTIEQFESLAVQTSGNTMRATDAITKAALKLDDQYHFLTESIYEQIHALEKDGDQKAASALAIDALAKATKERSEEMVANLGYVARSWNWIKEAIGGVGDALGNLGKKATPGIEVDKYVAQLKSFDAATAFRNQQQGRDPSALTAVQESERAEIVKNLTNAVIVKNKADADAIAQGNATLVQSEAMHAASRIQQDDTRLQKKGMTELQVAIQEYGQDLAKIAAANPNSPLLSMDAVNAHMAALTKAHTPAEDKGNDDRAKVLQDRLTLEQTALDREKSVYDARDKMLDLYHSKFGMSDTDFYAGRENARAEYLAAEAISFAKESALIRASEAQARNPREVAAAREKYDQLAKAHQMFVDGMRNAAGQDAAGAEAANAAVIDKSNTAMNGYLSSLDAEAQKLEDSNGAHEQTRSAIERETVARLDLAIAAQQQLMAEQAATGATDAEIEQGKVVLKYLQDMRAARSRLATDYATKEADDFSRKASLQAIQDWKDAGASIANSLSNAFGAGGKAMGQMFKAYADGVSGQLKAQKALAAAKNLTDDNPEKYDAIKRAQLDSAQAQVKSYGDMAQAAEGFFDKGSSGYRAMVAASEVLRVAEVGLSVVKGVNAVLTQGEGDPYSAFGRMAAMAAVVAGLGVALSGGGSAPSAASRQTAQGTGTILGDSNTKSDSINKSIELTASNSSIQINYLAGMEASLKSIESNIGSFASLLVRTTDVANPDINLKSGVGKTGWAQADMTATGAEIGLMLGAPLIGAFVGYVASKIPAIQHIYTSIFGGKQSLSDSGITLDKASLGSILQSGVNAQSYADITTSGGWFHGDSHDTKNTPLGADADQQFALVIKSMATSITQASSLLGVSGDDFTNKLDSFVVDIGNVSLKGLSGDEIQKQLEAVFSKVGDQMAQAAIPDLQQFQQVGEGYLQTLARVATDYAKLDASLQSIGVTFGSVGVASIGARENLISLLGGIDDFQSKTSDFAQNFLSKAQQLAPVQAYVTQQLASINLGWIKTREDFAAEVASLSGRLNDPGVQQTYVALMNIEAAFAAVTPAIVDTTKSIQDIADQRKGLQDKLDDLTMTSIQLHDKERATIDASNLVLYDRVSALQAEKDASQSLLSDVDNAFTVLQNVTKVTTDALNKRITAEQALSDAVKSTLASMQTSTTSLTDRASAQGQIKAAVAIAKAGGPLPTADSLKDALSVVSKDASAQFSTYADYLKDLYSTQADLSQLGNLADSSLSVDQRQLASLNSMLDVAQQQVNLLKGIDTTGLTIAQALAGFQGAVGVAQANPIVSANSSIVGLYQSLLGRAPDAAGLAYWQQAAAGGESLDTIRSAFMGGDEYKKLHSIPGFADGGDFAGGIRGVGEKGIEIEATGASRIHSTQAIINALRNPAASNEALVAEVKALRTEVQLLREANTAENTAIAKGAQQAGEMLDKFDKSGMPAVRTA